MAETKHNVSVGVGSLQDLLLALCEYSLKGIADADSEEEFAYLLGMFEVASSLCGAFSQDKGLTAVRVCGDYEKTKKMFQEWSETRNPGYQKQLMLDKIFKKVFETLDGAPSKSTKTKSKPKNEEA